MFKKFFKRKEEIEISVTVSTTPDEPYKPNPKIVEFMNSIDVFTIEGVRAIPIIDDRSVMSSVCYKLQSVGTRRKKDNPEYAIECYRKANEISDSFYPVLFVSEDYYYKYFQLLHDAGYPDLAEKEEVKHRKRHPKGLVEERRLYVFAEEGKSRTQSNTFTIYSPWRHCPCDICKEFKGVLMIDDVFANGKPDGDTLLLSDAIRKGFLHEGCKCQINTYFPYLYDNKEEDPLYKTLKKKYEYEKNSKV